MSTHQSVQLGRPRASARVLEWAINPKDGAATTYLAQVNFQPLPAKVEAQSVKQILSIS